MEHQSFLHQRIHNNPNRPLLEKLINYLVENGYSVGISETYIGAASHFGWWLGRRPFNAENVEKYLKSHLPVCQCDGFPSRDSHSNSGALGHLLRLSGIHPSPLKGFAREILERYRVYLVRERGHTPRTVKSSILHAIRTLMSLKARRKEDLVCWTSKRVHQHVIQAIKGRAGSTNCLTTGHIRAFLRFLYMEGLIAEDLAKSVPKVPFWRSPFAPQVLDQDTVNKIVAAAAIDRSPLGLRNYAIIMCLSELGIRAADVVGMKRGDVDYAARVLHLHNGKARQVTSLPISQRLAKALRAYILHGRPNCPSEWIFVHHRAPVGKSLSSHAVHDALKELSMAAGLPMLVRSTHAFRRAFAGKMLNGGATLKQIADILGHRSINTTGHYARTDRTALSNVALPWPGTSNLQS